MKIENNIEENDALPLVKELESVDISEMTELDNKALNVMKKFHTLSEPEKQILALYTYFKTYKAVGDKLNVHSYTVKAYINELRQKFKEYNDTN